MMEQKSSLDQTSLESFFFQISYVPPGEYGGRHLLEACPRHVSVHALLAECDRPMPAVMCLTGCFNPRTPCGVRHHGCAIESRTGRFQSTHSLRSATHHPLRHMLSIKRFNPRTPCGVRRVLASMYIIMIGFNPRTPCGVRRTPVTVTANGTWFQSTHSLRSATFRKDDLQFIPSSFNPRTPCGVRQIRYYPDYQPQLFQSTHSLRSATNPASHHNPGSQVSIHALLAECDCRF